MPVRGHEFQLPNCIYRFHKQSFIVSSLFRFLKYFFWVGFSLFSLLCAYVNCDFVLILILYCVILILILYSTTTYYYVFFQLEMHVAYV